MNAPPVLQPSDDPRVTPVAYARLFARLAAPFADRGHLLGVCSLEVAEFDPLRESWEKRLLDEPGTDAT